jgi:hypothetical protein
MKDTLQAINQMQADGVIRKYALGGAVGATLYLEPAATVDVDIFVLLPEASGSGLISLSGIYEYLITRGYKAQAEHIVIGAWPVQFLPASNALEEEALAEALPTEVEGVPAWVMTAEHLVAIALRTGRNKDHARIMRFLEQDVVDSEKLNRILEQHGLTVKWEKFKKRYLDG